MITVKLKQAKTHIEFMFKSCLHTSLMRAQSVSFYQTCCKHAQLQRIFEKPLEILKLSHAAVKQYCDMLQYAAFNQSTVNQQFTPLHRHCLNQSSIVPRLLLLLMLIQRRTLNFERLLTSGLQNGTDSCYSTATMQTTKLFL